MNNHTKEPVMPRLLPLVSLLLLALSAPLQADTLAIPAPEQPAATEAPATPAPSRGYSVTLPGRGMTMEQVEARFGPPRERLPSVGDPPITRWVYDDFTVYFEYEYVINAVPNVGLPKPAPAPKSEGEPAETTQEAAPQAVPAPAPAPAEPAPATGG